MRVHVLAHLPGQPHAAIARSEHTFEMPGEDVTDEDAVAEAIAAFKARGGRARFYDREDAARFPDGAGLGLRCIEAEATEAPATT